MKRSIFLATVIFTSSTFVLADEVIPYIKNPVLNVGQTMVIHGLRAKTCGEVPDISHVPKSKDFKTGSLSLGELGVRHSRRCGGSTPAYEVIFSAKKRGNEKIKLFGDNIKITVK